EKERLARAEGHWPLYPVTLVELADKHPLALPSQHGPAKLAELPVAVQAEMKSHFGKGGKDSKGGKKVGNLDNFLTKIPVAGRLENLGEKNLSKALVFNCQAATWARKAGVAIPFEMWPTKPSEMSKEMLIFLDPKGPF